MDFVVSTFKVSLCIVIQFYLDVVQCAVPSVGICYSFLLQYQDRRSAVVFLCSFEHGLVYAWVLLRKYRSVCMRSTNADASTGDICCGFPMQYRSAGGSSMCMWSCQGRTPQ